MSEALKTTRYSQSFKQKLNAVERKCKAFENWAKDSGKKRLKIGVLLVDGNGRVTVFGNKIIVDAVRESNAPNIVTMKLAESVEVEDVSVMNL